MSATRSDEAPEIGNRTRLLAVLAAFALPLVSGGALMYGAAVAGAPGEVRTAAEAAGALGACLWLVSRRQGDRALLRSGGVWAIGTGLGAGAVRAALWVMVLPSRAPGPVLAVTVAVVIQVALVALAEELQFRGILLARLRETMPLWAAVAVMVVLFTALHAYSTALLALPAVAADGILFAALALRFGSLGAPVAAHGLFNAATILLPVSAVAMTSGRLTAYTLAVVAVDAVLAATLGFVRKSRS